LLRETLDIIGDVPCLILIEAAWTRARTIDEFRTATRLPITTIRNRLLELADAGLLLPSLTGDLEAWKLTPAGMAFYPVAVVMLAWEVRWNEQSPAARVRLVHMPCGRTLTPRLEGSIAPHEPPTIGKRLSPRRRRSRDSVDAIRSYTVVHGSVRILGDRWASLVLWTLRIGAIRFGEIRSALSIASNILTERLKWLEAIGLVSRKVTLPHSPYVLTEKGEDFLPVLDLVEAWGSAWLENGVARPNAPVMRREVLCDHCQIVVIAQDVSLVIPSRVVTFG